MLSQTEKRLSSSTIRKNKQIGSLHIRSSFYFDDFCLFLFNISLDKRSIRKSQESLLSFTNKNMKMLTMRSFFKKSNKSDKNLLNLMGNSNTNSICTLLTLGVLGILDTVDYTRLHGKDFFSTFAVFVS